MHFVIFSYEGYRMIENIVERCSTLFVDSLGERLEHRDCDRHGLCSKLTCAILLCPWKRHFTAFAPAWRLWQAVHFSFNF